MRFRRLTAACKQPAPPERDIETVKALLESARYDYEDEKERTRVLDTKLSGLAAFCGLSISITVAFGGTVVATDRLPSSFSIALGAVLGVSATLLLVGVALAFGGLKPKLFAGVSTRAARRRLSNARLIEDAPHALATLAATYVKLLGQARAVNETKATAANRAYHVVGFGFGGLVTGLLVTVIGSVTWVSESSDTWEDDLPEPEETVPLGKSLDDDAAETLEDAADDIVELRESDETVDLPLSDDQDRPNSSDK